MKRHFWACSTEAIWCLAGFLQPRNIAECWAWVTDLTLEEAPQFRKASGLCSHLQFMSSIGLAGFHWVAPPVPPRSLPNLCLESYDNLSTVVTILLQLLQVLFFHKSQPSAGMLKLVLCEPVQGWKLSCCPAFCVPERWNTQIILEKRRPMTVMLHWLKPAGDLVLHVQLKKEDMEWSYRGD